MSEVTQGPRSSVFTTMRFSKRRGLFLIKHHIARMIEHAAQLKIDATAINLDSIVQLLQEIPPEMEEGLLRIECTRSLQLRATYRSFSIQNENVDAVTLPSPVWPARIAGTKHGAWDAYIQARQQAEQMGADLALMVHEYSIVDGDRCSPLVLDEDGVIWASDSNTSVDSVTFQAVHDSLLDAGFHIQHGRLNERLVARCVEVVAVGSGVGVLKIDSIDGEPIGDGSSRLFDCCNSCLERLYNSTENWAEVWS